VEDGAKVHFVYRYILWRHVATIPTLFLTMYWWNWWKTNYM